MPFRKGSRRLRGEEQREVEAHTGEPFVFPSSSSFFSLPLSTRLSWVGRQRQRSSSSTAEECAHISRFLLFSFLSLLGILRVLLSLAGFFVVACSQKHTRTRSRTLERSSAGVSIYSSRSSQRNQRNIISLPYIPLSVALPLSLRSFSRSTQIQLNPTGASQ
jgi:hypothetical protein